MRALGWLVAALLAAGCADGPSLVVVNVSADAPLDGVAALAVTASAGGRSASFAIDAPGGALSLDPATQSFGIQLPKGMKGTIDVTVEAHDAGGNVLATGSGSGPIKTSGRTDVAVELTVAAPAGDDMSGAPDDLAGGGAPGDMALPSTAAMLTADRTTQAFGSVTVGKSSNSVMIKVTNGGDMTTGTPTFTPSGTNLAEFALSNGCTAALMPNASCYVTAQFNPTSMGAKSAHFDVAATPGGTVGVDLTGTGEPPGTLSISADAPYNGDCGSAVIGQTSTTFATYTVTNVGSSMTGTMMVTTGDPQFLASGCSGSLAPGATCSITVHIKPTVGGVITSSVSVTASPGGTAPANVKGKGLNPAAFKITSSTGSFDFGTAARNSAGNVITFTATNTGDVASALLTTSTFGGAGATSFIVTSDGCKGQMVAAAGTCMVQVEFKPLSSGTLDATLQINDAGGVRGMANVTGVGTPIWVQETLPLPTGQTAVPGLSSVFGVSGDGSHIYAAGSGYYYVRDATGTWSAYAINPAAVSPNVIAEGWAVGTNSVFLASDVGVLRSTAPASWSAPFEPGPLDGLVAFSASDGFAANDTIASGALTTYRLGSSGWVTDATITGYADGGNHRAPLYGTGDSDVWLGGGAPIPDANNITQYTAVVWHRDATNTWTRLATTQACHTCPGSVLPKVHALWGFGTPTTTLFASTMPVAPAMYTTAGGWTTLANLPTNMGGSAKTCPGVWGSSPTSVWFSCMGGMFRYTGGGTWDANAQLNIQNFQSVWGSSANDVYAVGTDTNGAGFVYHYF